MLITWSYVKGIVEVSGSSLILPSTTTCPQSFLSSGEEIDFNADSFVYV